MSRGLSKGGSLSKPAGQWVPTREGLARAADQGDERERRCILPRVRGRGVILVDAGSVELYAASERVAIQRALDMFEVVGDTTNIQLIATGRGIRRLKNLETGTAAGVGGNSKVMLPFD